MIGTRRRSLWLATLIVMLGVPSRLLAQCAFDAPTNAKGIKTSMVRAYAGCVGGITFPASNTSTMAGVPGCTPPFPLSEYRFADDKGGCSVQISQIYKSPCPNGIDTECADVKLKVKCSGVLNPDGMTPTSTGTWVLNVVTRETFDDQSAGDVTIIDLASQFTFQQPSGGQLKLAFSYYDLPCFLICPPPLPACMQLGLVSASILDPSGNVFAVLGSSSR
jgi:hypothetical protein